MRVRWTYVSTGLLIAIALGAPFALPRLLANHGSGALVLTAAAPPAEQSAVVQMAALPQPTRVPRARPVLAHTSPGSPVFHASLASAPAYASAPAHSAPALSLHVRTTPAAPREAVLASRHRPAPVEPARPLDPAAPPAAPTPPAVAAQPPQQVNLNATIQSVAPPPAPAPAPASAQAVTAPAAQGSPSVGEQRGNGQDKSQGHGQGHGHGHDHDD